MFMVTEISQEELDKRKKDVLDYYYFWGCRPTPLPEPPEICTYEYAIKKQAELARANAKSNLEVKCSDKEDLKE